MVFGFFEKHFEAKDIPDLSGKVAIVTGGNTGIGYQSVLHLADHNAKVYLAARTEARALEAIAKVKEQIPHANVVWLKMDLMDLASVKEASKQFKEKETRLDILLNNAGIMAVPYEISKDGLEVQFQTNHMGHFLFTHELLPTLISTSKLPGSSVRIVTVSSMAHNIFAGTYQFETLEQVNRDHGSTWSRYAQSKLANILFTTGLEKHLKNEKIFANSLHPGAVDTELSRGPTASYGKLLGGIYSAFSKVALVSSYKGALTSLYCATSPEVEEQSFRAKYFVPIAKVATPSAQAQDEKLADQLWDLSVNFLKEKGFISA
ncbi:hypothetical protein SpCBS45565_g01724 [Spizellomyces sp. 'palustris']|nr:hypothetical protein SpCBS45565_g01724 [Spizellomyces sp. 'palustris']